MFFAEELASLKEHGLYRRLRMMDGPQEARVNIDGREILLFSSNNYLGFSTHPDVKASCIRAVEEFGTGSGGSRLTTGNMRLHRKLEEKVAGFKGAEDAIVFNTGYMTNLGAIAALMGKGDLIASDELNHASIIDGCRLSRAEIKVFAHSDVRDLRCVLAGASSYRRRLIVVDGVFSMDGDIAPLPLLLEIASEYNALLMVDDAHATGVLGRKGTGTVEYFGLKGKPESKAVIQMGTLSKAFGSEGGYVAGSRELIDYLRNKARSFIFSTAFSPGSAAAAIAAIEVLEREPQILQRLRLNINYLVEGLRRLGYRVEPTETAIIPVPIGDSKQALAMAAHLEELGIFVPAIRPPTVPEGTSRLRVTVMATHTTRDIDIALEAFKKAGKAQGLI